MSVEVVVDDDVVVVVLDLEFESTQDLVSPFFFMSESGL